jgi:hypothetical protein
LRSEGCFAYLLSRRVAAWLVLACIAGFLALGGQQEALADFEKVLTVDISGPGLAAPIRLKLSDVFTLGNDLAVVPRRLGAAAAESPTSRLGPSYELRYYVELVDGRSFTLKQTLYPYAAGGPVVFTAPNQRFVDPAFGGTFLVASGWTRSSGIVDAVEFLGARGLPEPPSASSTGWDVLVVVGSLVAILLAILVIRYQHRQRA